MNVISLHAKLSSLKEKEPSFHLWWGRPFFYWACGMNGLYEHGMPRQLA